MDIPKLLRGPNLKNKRCCRSQKPVDKKFFKKKAGHNFGGLLNRGVLEYLLYFSCFSQPSPQKKYRKQSTFDTIRCLENSTLIHWLIGYLMKITSLAKNLSMEVSPKKLRKMKMRSSCKARRAQWIILRRMIQTSVAAQLRKNCSPIQCIAILIAGTADKQLLKTIVPLVITTCMEQISINLLLCFLPQQLPPRLIS